MLVFVMMLALIVFQPSKKEEEESEKRSGKARELEKEEVCCFHLCIDAVIVWVILLATVREWLDSTDPVPCPPQSGLSKVNSIDIVTFKTFK